LFGRHVKKAAYLFMVALFLLCIHFSTAWAKAKTVVTQVERLNVREGPGTHYPVKKKLNKGEVYTTIAETNGWVQLRLNEKESGWVSQQYVAETNKKMTSMVDQLRIRSAPSSQSSVIGYLQRGQTVDVIEVKNNWAKIKTAALIGWVSSDYLTSSDNVENNAGSTRVGTVTADTLNVRAQPFQQSNVLGKITFGQQVRIVDETNDWYKITINERLTGWVYRTYIAISASYVKVLYDGTNIRTNPSLEAEVQTTAKRGQQYRVIGKVGNWYKIELPGQGSGYIADSLVIVMGNNRNEHTIKNKTIVIDAGHGGKDSGTIGKNGIMEKTLTLQTAQLLQNKLQKAGANVILTRTTDTYLSLPERVQIAHRYHADAFISIHYDSSPNWFASGMTIYYYDSLADYPLALSFDALFSKITLIPYRGIRFGDFHVIRETNLPSVLFELGYVSNPLEVNIITSYEYQQQITEAIFNGLNNYFESSN
jgi:N-acetylmuramoyl-L-alanine amidase